MKKHIKMVLGMTVIIVFFVAACRYQYTLSDEVCPSQRDMYYGVPLGYTLSDEVRPPVGHALRYALGYAFLEREDMRQRDLEKKDDIAWYELAGKMKVPTKEEISENSYVHRYNYELCREKGLIKGDGLGYHYLCMQAIYRANLDAYLLEVLDLEALNEELKKSDLRFVCQKPENRNLYERESTMELEFIYLRNNLYIEYLGKDQLELLENQLKTGKTAVTDEIREMVKATYREVIRVRKPGNWKDQSSFFYSAAQGCKPEIPNQALVLQISNAMEYDSYGNLLPKDRMREKCEYLDKVKMEKEKEYFEILGTKVYILIE